MKGQSSLLQTGVPTPNLFLSQAFRSREGTGALSNTVLLGTTRVSLPNGISFHPTVLGGYMTVTDDMHTDGHRDRQTTLR